MPNVRTQTCLLEEREEALVTDDLRTKYTNGGASNPSTTVSMASHKRSAHQRAGNRIHTHAKILIESRESASTEAIRLAHIASSVGLEPCYLEIPQHRMRIVPHRSPCALKHGVRRGYLPKNENGDCGQNEHRGTGMFNKKLHCLEETPA